MDKFSDYICRACGGDHALCYCGEIKDFVCEFCGIYAAEKPKCNQCQEEER